MSAANEHSWVQQLGRVQRIGLGLGVLGLGAAVLGLLFAGPAFFFHGYLTAFVFWVGLPLGCLALLMLHHLTATAWGFVTQRLLEAGALTAGLMAVLFIPIFFGMHELYHWANEHAVETNVLLQHKKPYLNIPFYIIRTVIYFAFWGTAAYLLDRWSLRMDETGDAKYAVWIRRLSAGGLIAHVLLLTFASVDWIMSLEPEWFSTIFGWLLLVSQALAALALMSLMLWRVHQKEPLNRVVKTKHFHDYGNLTLAFVVLWTYLMFMQYLIIWSGNIPEDIRWYVHRQSGGWGWVAPVLILFHFVLPFVLLLFRRTKRNAGRLAAVAVGIMAAHVLYVLWLVLPSFQEETTLHTYWITLAAFVGIGGLWGAAYAWLLARRSLLPSGDPRFQHMMEGS